MTFTEMVEKLEIEKKGKYLGVARSGIEWFCSTDKEGKVVFSNAKNEPFSVKYLWEINVLFSMQWSKIKQVCSFQELLLLISQNEDLKFTATWGQFGDISGFSLNKSPMSLDNFMRHLADYCHNDRIAKVLLMGEYHIEG